MHECESVVDPEQTSGLDLQIGGTVKAWGELSKSHAGDETVVWVTR